MSEETKTNELTPQEVNHLATYNSERSRGLMHSAEWTKRMIALQNRYDKTIHRGLNPGAIGKAGGR